jgi:hypothetical protein
MIMENNGSYFIIMIYNGKSSETRIDFLGTPYFRKPPHTVDGCEILHQLIGRNPMICHNPSVVPALSQVINSYPPVN